MNRKKDLSSVFNKETNRRIFDINMNIKLPELKKPIDNSQRSLRFIFVMLYISILGSVFYFSNIEESSIRVLNFYFEKALTIFFFLLLCIEAIEKTKFEYEAPKHITMLFLVLRAVLVLSLLILSDSDIALFISPVVPFSAYFSYGGNVSLLFSILFGMAAVLKANMLDVHWYSNVELTNNIIALAFTFLFVQVLANLVYSEEKSRRYSDQLLEDLKASHLKLQIYADQVAELAAAEERNRLARDIHDSLGHYLTAINIQLEKAIVFQNRNLEESTQAIRDAKATASEALQEVRRSVSSLRSDENKFSFSESIHSLINSFKQDDFEISLEIAGEELGFSRSALMTLYRVAQEGLTNAQKHAHANLIQLEIHFEKHHAKMILKDDGVGFDISTLDALAASPNSNFGLQGIQERVELAQGKMSITSQPDQGTELIVTVPKYPMLTI